MTGGFGIPVTSSGTTRAHEFSGLFDLSDLLAKHGLTYVESADEQGYMKRIADATVPINGKNILVGLQAHNPFSGVIADNQCDRGGQWLVYQPDI